MSDKRKKCLKPTALRTGDSIGVVAPAGPFDREKFQQGIEELKIMGFEPSIPSGVYEKDGYFAGSDEHRADLLNRFFADNTIKAVVCARGGFGSIRILSLLDFDTIRDNPKIFIGFSDITAIISALYNECGLISFHGPMVTTLADADQKSKDAMFSALTGYEKLEFTLQHGIAIKSGNSSGIVSGGNLATLCHLVGTPFEPDFDGHILIFEDIGEAPYKIDRMLSQMRLAGCFDRLAGLVIGSFKDCGEPDDVYRIVENIFKDDDIPILAGFEIGHMSSNITIPIGLTATLDTENNKLVFHESAVCPE